MKHLENDAKYQSTSKVFDKLGLGDVEISVKTSQPFDE